MDPSLNIKATTTDHDYADDDDGPVYKSVAIASQMSENVFQSVALGMQNVHLRDTVRPKFNSPVLEHVKPKAVSMAEPEVYSGDVSDIVKRSNWKLKEQLLPSIPSYYPMEKTFYFMPADKATPTTIAARVSDACMKMSIFALYNGEKGMAHLTSADFVEFYVFLFKTSAATDSRGDGTVVEVQRRKGCTLSFHRYARKILSAVKGEDDVDFDEASRCNEAPVLSEKFLGQVQQCLATERKNTLDALDIAGNLLKKDRFDANMLGMESLCLLTDCTKSGPLTSALVSRVILCGTMRPMKGTSPEKEGVGEKTNLEEEAFLIQSLDIRSRIMSLIQSKKLTQDGYESDDDLELTSRSEYFGDDHCNHMHNLALAALSNALSNIAKNGSLSETCSEQPWLNGAELVSTLVDLLKQAERRPHDAVLSARCLGNLVQASQAATERAFKMDALAVVEAAKHIGETRHAILARETDGLHEKLSVRAVNA